MKYEVVVSFKPEVLDTQARAIKTTLDRLGYKSLSEFKVAKRFELEFPKGTKDADDLVASIADKVLANPVSEQYRIQKLEE